MATTNMLMVISKAMHDTGYSMVNNVFIYYKSHIILSYEEFYYRKFNKRTITTNTQLHTTCQSQIVVFKLKSSTLLKKKIPIIA